MAPEKCQPFDLNRQGLLLGEGAGLLVLESEAHAMRRGATPAGRGRRLRPLVRRLPHHAAAPRGRRAASPRCARAIERSGLAPDDVDFVNAHGTGTRHNDAAEAKVMRDVFGDRRVPISSMKSMLGHCMGAASALEAIGCVFTLETGIYPPTIGYETPDPECDVDVVANVARARQGRRRRQQLARLRRLQRRRRLRAPGRPARRPQPRLDGRGVKPRAITGLGVVSALGVGREAFFAAMRARGASATRRRAGRELRRVRVRGRAVAEVRGFDAAKYLGDKGLRSLDRLTKLLVVATRLALHDARLKKRRRVRAARSPRAGRASSCSNAYGSLEAITELDRVATLEDARYINPSRFPLTVSNSARGLREHLGGPPRPQRERERRQLRRARRRRVRRRAPRAGRAPTRCSSAAPRR